jgi:hypothetical protein
MRLNLYVTPLCRYYAGDRKSVIQQAAEQEGLTFHVVGPGKPPPDAITDASRF